jgi:hypothetical protein
MVFAGCLALLAAVGAGAQTKTSGTLKCDKPEPVYSIEVGDRPGHAMLLEKSACSWTQGLAIGSDKAKEGTNVATVEVTATRGVGNGAHVSTMESGDKFFVSYQYISPMKDGKPGETSGKWSYTGGTGKLKGVKGGGTFKVTFGQDGTSTAEVEGEYTLAGEQTKK